MVQPLDDIGVPRGAKARAEGEHERRARKEKKSPLSLGGFGDLPRENF